MSTIIQQGTFTAGGGVTTLVLRNDVDWLKVINYTVINAATASYGAEFYWQRGMTANDGIINAFDGAGTGMVMTTAAAGGVDGFTLVDTSANPLTGPVVVTGATNVVAPVVATGNTTGLADGSIVRLFTMTGQESLAGIDFEVDTIVNNVSFTISYNMANAPGAAATAGTYRIVKWDPIFYPRWRFIANITQAASAVITTTVSHLFTVGQIVRFAIPAVYDMVELDGLQGSITDITAGTITVDIDTTAFTAFSFALPADVPFSPAIISPIGEDVSVARDAARDELGDSIRNVAYIGIDLGAGNTSPSGNANDVIYWVAGKSFQVTND